MYEHKTFEVLLSEMLAYVKGKCPDLDTRTGSIIYNALASVAMELETAYHEMDMIMDETFLETASKEYLCKHGALLGVELREATNAHFVGEFNVNVGVGCRFNLDKFNFTTIEKLSDPTDTNSNYRYELVCEEPGSEANGCSGTLTPITYTESLTHCELVEVISYGEDEEDTEEYRYRIFQHINSPIASGNVNFYKSLLDNYEGLGVCLVKPTVMGANTVRIIISDPDNRPVSDELLTKVQNYFDPPIGEINDDTTDESYPQGRGMGNGEAPIGAIVTVISAIELPVKIECDLWLKANYVEPIGVQQAIEDYFRSISVVGGDVNYLRLSAAIFGAESVRDIDNLVVTIRDQVMDMNTSPFINTVQVFPGETLVLDTENSVWRY